MASTKKITIELITGGAKEPEKTPEEIEEEKRAKEEEELQKKKEKTKNYIKNTLKHTGHNIAQATVDRYFSLTEDYASQTALKNMQSAWSEVKSFSSKVGVASLLGPVAVGVTIATYAIDKIVATRGAYSEIRKTINAGNYNLQFQSTRMSLVDNGRGTEN